MRKSNVHGSVLVESVKLELPDSPSFDDPKLCVTAAPSSCSKPFETLNHKFKDNLRDSGKTEDNIQPNSGDYQFHSKRDLVTISSRKPSASRIINTAYPTVEAVSGGGEDESDGIKLKRKPSSFVKMKEIIVDFGETFTHTFKPVFKKNRFPKFWNKIELKIIEVKFLFF